MRLRSASNNGVSEKTKAKQELPTFQKNVKQVSLDGLHTVLAREEEKELEKVRRQLSDWAKKLLCMHFDAHLKELVTSCFRLEEVGLCANVPHIDTLDIGALSVVVCIAGNYKTGTKQ